MQFCSSHGLQLLHWRHGSRAQLDKLATFVQKFRAAECGQLAGVWLHGDSGDPGTLDLDSGDSGHSLLR